MKKARGRGKTDFELMFLFLKYLAETFVLKLRLAGETLSNLAPDTPWLSRQGHHYRIPKLHLHLSEAKGRCLAAKGVLKY